VKWKTNANTRAWTAATVVLDPPEGRLNRIPGVKTKKSTATYKIIQAFIMALYNIQKYIIFMAKNFPIGRGIGDSLSGAKRRKVEATLPPPGPYNFLSFFSNRIS
jgi:hypothetical protein